MYIPISAHCFFLSSEDTLKGGRKGGLAPPFVAPAPVMDHRKSHISANDALWIYCVCKLLNQTRRNRGAKGGGRGGSNCHG